MNRNVESKKFKDNENQIHMLHSMSSCDYLKLDAQNNIFFECAQEEKILRIQCQYKSKRGENRFEDIYKIKISAMNIRQLLLMQSIFHCDTSLDVLKLVGMQANPKIFYESFLELDRKNMVSILAFDSNSIKSLISEQFADYFEEDFPIFYMNKLVTYTANPDKRSKSPDKETKLYSAIDTAIENNQIRGVSLIIDHIVNYQDNYVSFVLFRSNFTDLMHKGLSLQPLLCSNIFYKKLEFEDWPSAHTELEKMFVPYSGSLFEMRYSYDEIFPALGDPMNEEDFVKDPQAKQHDSQESNKFYSITYKVNLLPSVIYDEVTGEAAAGRLLESIQDQGENELEIFESQAI